MNHTFSHLVWLGANTASEPEGMLDKAAHATLFEAREAACKALQQKFPQKNITVKRAALAVNNTVTNFTEYNLAEFSAIQPVTGLKNLFPGLKKISGEQLNGTAIGDAISSLKLNNSNNLLIVDIGDSGLALLTSIEESKQLHLFNEIYVQAASEPLYANSATAAEITTFLQAQSYLLQKTTGNDPELPWLTFCLNPLWETLQKSRQQLATEQEVRKNFSKELEKYQNVEQGKIKEITKLRAELEQVSKHAVSQAEKIVQQEKANRDIMETNEQLQKRQNLLQLELIKAEAQISVIKDLLLKH